jgi:hypothetical protein
LYHQEQNDAPRIIQLVSDGDVDTALERIEKFGGEDKEGLQRKFTLYMLCLMELTLLDSKESPNSVKSIEKILNGINTKLKKDISILNWGSFFSGYLMFKIISKLHHLRLDFKILYEYTDCWSYDWIQYCQNLNTQDFYILRIIAQIDLGSKARIKNLIDEKEFIFKVKTGVFDMELYDIDSFKSNAKGCAYVALKIMAYNPLFSQRLFEDSLEIARNSFSKHHQIISLLEVSRCYFLANKKNQSIDILNEAWTLSMTVMENANRLKFKYFEIIVEFIKQGEVAYGLDKLETIDNLDLYFNVIEELIQLGKFSDAITTIKKYLDEDSLIFISKKIFEKLTNTNTFEQFIELLNCENKSENILHFQLLKHQQRTEYKNKPKRDQLYFKDLIEKSEAYYSSNNIEEPSKILNEIVHELYLENKIIRFPRSVKFQGSQPSNVIDIVDIKMNEYNFSYKEFSLLPYYQNNFLASIKKSTIIPNADIISELLISSLENVNSSNSLRCIKYILENNVYPVSENLKMKLAEQLINLGQINEVFSLLEHYWLDSNKIKTLQRLQELVENDLFKSEFDSIHINLLTSISGFYEEQPHSLFLEDVYEKLKYLNFYGNKYETNLLVEDAFLFLSKSENFIKSYKLLGFLIEFLLLINRFDLINELILKIKSVQNEINKNDYSELIIDVTKVLAENRKNSEALVLISILESKSNLKECHFIDKALFNVINSMLDNGLYVEANQYIQNLSSINFRVMLKAKYYILNPDNSKNWFEKIRSDIELLQSSIVNFSLDARNKISDNIECFVFIAMLFEDADQMNYSNYLWNIAFNEAEKMLNIRHPSRNSRIKIKAMSESIISILEKLVTLEKWDMISGNLHRIISTQMRQEFLFNMGKNYFETRGFEASKKMILNFKTKDIIYMNRGIKDSIQFVDLDINAEIVKESINDLFQLEKTLECYALKKIFFSNLPQEKLDRYNRTLELQWAIDIKNQLPN